jgi:hypothetical protein
VGSDVQFFWTPPFDPIQGDLSRESGPVGGSDGPRGLTCYISCCGGQSDSHWRAARGRDGRLTSAPTVLFRRRQRKRNSYVALLGRRNHRVVKLSSVKFSHHLGSPTQHSTLCETAHPTPEHGPRARRTIPIDNRISDWACAIYQIPDTRYAHKTSGTALDTSSKSDCTLLVGTMWA